MIYIEQGQKIADHEHLKVKSPSGEYDDYALIEFSNVKDGGRIVGSFQAQYVKYGGLVYRFNEVKELGEAILAIDPESTHGAASFVRMSNELLAQMNGKGLQEDSLEKIMEKEGLTKKRVLPKEREEVDDMETEEDEVEVVSDKEVSLDDTVSVVEDVNRKVEQISRTAEKISDVVETIAR